MFFLARNRLRYARRRSFAEITEITTQAGIQKEENPENIFEIAVKFLIPSRRNLMSGFNGINNISLSLPLRDSVISLSLFMILKA
jgi:hypothetical protein